MRVLIYTLLLCLLVAAIASAQHCGDGLCNNNETLYDCPNDCSIDLANNTLVIYNSNNRNSRDIAEYYAEKRGINSTRLCPVTFPPGQFALKKHFLGARKTIIENCICNAIRETVPSHMWPEPCDTSNIDTIAELSPITHLVIIRGIPPRLRGTGWATDSSGPSLDYYLSRLLYYNSSILDDAESNGMLNETTFAGSYDDSIDFQTDDSIKGYARPINTSLDRIVAYGRVEAITKNRTLELIDRTLESESRGVRGNFLVGLASHVIGGTSKEVYDLFSEMTSSTSPECMNYLQEPYGEWPYNICRTGATANGEIPGESGSTIPRAINAGVFLGGEPYGNGQAGFDGFNVMLHWHKSEYDCIELCRDFPTPEEQDACREASTDYFREINTDCVGASDGLIGWQLRSFPVQFYGFWPPGWIQTSSGPATKTPPHVKSGDAYIDSVFTDDKYLHFGSNETVENPVCVLEDGTTEACNEIVGVNLRMPKYFAPYLTLRGTKNYTVRFRYRNEASPGSRLYVRLRARFRENTSDTTIATKSFELSEPTNNWITKEINLSLVYDGYNITRLYFDIYTTLNAAPRHGVDLDAFEIFDSDSGESLCDLSVCSFNSSYIGYTTSGDYASNAIDRLGGIAWWGSSSHHLTGGFAFSPSDKFAGAFYGGRSLGESLAYTGKLAVSGIIYGDPLYRPSGAKIFMHNTKHLNEKAIIRDRYSFNQVNKPDDIYINAFHGHSNFNSTNWQLSVCHEENITLCDSENAWREIESGEEAVYDYKISSSLMDLVNDPDADESFIMRLRVWNPGDEANDLKNYAYFNYVYMSPDCADNDNDGYFSGENCRIEDCNDTDPDIHPYRLEECNGLDDNCNGETDEYCRCAADFNMDGVVNDTDKTIFFEYYQRNDCFERDVPCCIESEPPCKGDFDFDGDVDFKDFFTFARKYYGKMDCILCIPDGSCGKNENVFNCPDDCLYLCDTVEPGDSDCNGIIDNRDYDAFISHMIGHASSTPTMDCDEDGDINMTLDLLCIQEKISFYRCNNDSICQERESVLTCFPDCGYLCDDKRIGDADCNGIINMDDINAIRDVFFNDAYETPTMDCNRDGIVSVADALCIRPLLECNSNGTCDINETFDKCPSDCLEGDANQNRKIEKEELVYAIMRWIEREDITIRELMRYLRAWKRGYI